MKRNQLLLNFLSGTFACSLAPKAARFAAGLDEPERAQGRRLRRFLMEAQSSQMGQRLRYDRINSFSEFQNQVPVVDYDALESDIARIAAGEPNVLTPQVVRAFETSGGSTSTNKLIPYTQSLLADFSAATAPWLFDLFRHRPPLCGLRQYWSISPVKRDRKLTSGGITIGFDDDREYFGSVGRWVLGKVMAVPSSVRLEEDLAAWRRVTLQHLIDAQDLGLISVWSPSFLLLLMGALERDLPYYLGRLTDARQREIQNRLSQNGAFTGEALWPNLRVISMWADGPSAELVSQVQSLFPTVLIQPKGLLATEGVVTIPWFAAAGVGAVPAVCSHLIELIDLNHPSARPLPVWAALVGANYSPVLTTGNGFARYHLKDVLRCTGRHRGVPLFRFDGKLDNVSDLFGEKINARQVDEALVLAYAQTHASVRFALLAPVQSSPPSYRLFIESNATDEVLRSITTIVEGHLSTGHHYSYCRALEQLGPIEATRVTEGREKYHHALLLNGYRFGDLKPTHLDTRCDWRAVFER